MTRRFTLAVFLLTLTAFAARAGTIPSLSSAPLPFSGEPRSAALGSDGKIWLADRNNNIGRLDPATGTYTPFPIPTAKAGAGGLSLGPDGNIWFAEFTPQKIGRVTPDGVITEFPLAAGRQPGTTAAGPDKSVWFDYTEQKSTGSITSIGRISVVDGAQSTVTQLSGGFVLALRAGADRNTYVAVNSSTYQVLKITPAGQVTTFTLPATTKSNALGADMLLASDLNIWFIYGNALARLKPDGTVTLFQLPTQNTNLLPSGLTTGVDGNIWFTEFSSGKIGQLVLDSATDSGQATINEADLGGQPQTIILLPGESQDTRPNVVRAFDSTDCGDQNFVVLTQQSTSSSATFKLASTPYAKCADLGLSFSAMAFYKDQLHPEQGRTLQYIAFAGNKGRDEASNVVVKVAPAVSESKLVITGPTADKGGMCTVTGGGGATCTWATVPKGEGVEVTFTLSGTVISTVSLTGVTFSATADPIVTNNVAAADFLNGYRPEYDVVPKPISPDIAPPRGKR